MSTLGYSKERRQHPFFPFTFTSTDIMDTACFCHYEVIFTEDFGRIKAGDEFDSVHIDYDDGTIDFYRDEPNAKRVLKIKFKCVPK